MSAWSNARGTVKEQANFKVEEDVAALRKAIEGLDIGGRPGGRHSRRLRGLVGGFGNASCRLDCHEVMKAMKGPGTTESTLTEIFASRSNKQIKALSDVYLKETERLIDHDLKSEVSGDYGKALLILAEGKREETTNVDSGKAKADAKALYEAGEKKWGTDEDKFIDILCHRSVPQLRQTLIEYKNISKKTLQESIESEMSGDLEKLLVAVVKCVKNVPAYFAERLFKAMKGAGTTENTLTRIMVSRSEIDLMDIKAEYKKLFGLTLYNQLESEVSGNYGETLKQLCGQDG